MGAVYLVKHQRLGKSFALKETLFSDDDEQLRKAFEREAQLLANLDHPALPKVTDHFTEGGSQFLLMGYVPGEDLGVQLRQRGGPCAVETVLEWADQLLDALEYLHAHDPPIIHRDIKPQNLKLNERGKIILLDFGLAKGSTSEMSHQSRSIPGLTPTYAPLEQVQGEHTDARSDLYSLAATVYHLLTAVTPPQVVTRVAAIADGRADPLRSAREVNPQVNMIVSSVLMQAMARNPNQRPPSAAAMRKALREALSEGTERPIVIALEPEARALAETIRTSSEPVDRMSTSPAVASVSPVLIKRLEEGDIHKRVSALAELAGIGGDESFLLITKAFDDSMPEIRNAAAHALYNFQNDRAATFTRALREGSIERRRKIGAAIGTSGLAMDAIHNLVGQDRDRTYDAFSILFLMAKAGEVEPLMRSIEDYPDVEVRLKVIKLLSLSKQVAVVPALRRLAVRGTLPSEVRSAVMEGIYQLSRQGAE